MFWFPSEMNLFHIPNSQKKKKIHIQTIMGIQILTEQAESAAF